MSASPELSAARAICPCWGDTRTGAPECVGDEGVVCELHAKVAAALSAARREGAAEAYKKAEMECEVKVRRESGYGGRWEWYGAHMGDRTGPECAAAIRALAEKEERR